MAAVLTARLIPAVIAPMTVFLVFSALSLPLLPVLIILVLAMTIRRAGRVVMTAMMPSMPVSVLISIFPPAVAAAAVLPVIIMSTARIAMTVTVPIRLTILPVAMAGG